jgi:phosphoribosylformylglycinamidine synthase
MIDTLNIMLGMMPHPERCCEGIMGSNDGKLIFESLLRSR